MKKGFLRVTIKKPKLLKDLLLTGNISFTFVKNICQYGIGATAVMLVFFRINFLTFLVGAMSFLITYCSIYLFNDINDMKEDKKNKEKVVYKGLASGQLSVEKAVSILFILIIVGFFLSLLLNSFFRIFLLLSLFGNFLHSSNYTRFKKKGIVHIFFGKGLADFSKYALGWFSQTQNLTRFPFTLFLVLSIFSLFAYYYITKKRLTIEKNKISIVEWKKALVLLSVAGVLAILTFILIPFKTFFFSGVIMLILTTGIISLLKRAKTSKEINQRYNITAKIYFFIIFFSIIFYLTLDTPLRIDYTLESYVNTWLREPIRKVALDAMNLENIEELKEKIDNRTYDFIGVIDNKTVLLFNKTHIE